MDLTEKQIEVVGAILCHALDQEHDVQDYSYLDHYFGTTTAEVEAIVVLLTGAAASDETKLVDLVPETRVRLKNDVERYPHFIARAGATGVVSRVEEDGLVCVRLDETLAGAEEWDNEVHWYVPNGDEPQRDLEIVKEEA